MNYSKFFVQSLYSMENENSELRVFNRQCVANDG